MKNAEWMKLGIAINKIRLKYELEHLQWLSLDESSATRMQMINDANKGKKERSESVSSSYVSEIEKASEIMGFSFVHLGWSLESYFEYQKQESTWFNKHIL